MPNLGEVKQVEKASEKVHKKQIKEIDPLELSKKRPDWSAVTPVTKVQQIVIIIICLLLLLALLWAPWQTVTLFIALCTVFYTLSTIYKFVAIRSSISPTAIISFSAEQIAAEDPREWPMFSMLLPMYKEPETLSQMVKALTEMDYPADKKDIQLLLEEDDVETRRAAEQICLPQGFRVTLIPPSFPRTKPKACNIGLYLATGKYLVIYDAEDIPEPDQLKKAVMAFEANEEMVVCVQSRLNYYNSTHNIITRWFTAEYSAWFDLQLPGLSAMGAAIPLGGTSNHFKTAVLRKLMGWDAYNVTEDCDLGIRLARAGYKTCMLETTTWEEACSKLNFWIRQRTRWHKGYIQTWFVHMRNPVKLMKDLGIINFFHYQMLIGGGTFSVLINPFFWIMTLIWFIFRPPGIAALFPGPIFFTGAFCLFLGNFVFIYINLLGCYKRNRDTLAWWSLLTPIYWMMMSYGGWRAFIQFFRDPFVWEKTQHGLSGKTGEGN